MKVLVQFNDNYADEFDIEGFRILTIPEWEEYQRFVQEDVAWPQGFYFGTNEGNEYDSADDLLRHYSSLQISDNEAEVLMSLKGYSKEYGYGVMLGPNIDEPEEYTEPRGLY